MKRLMQEALTLDVKAEVEKLKEASEKATDSTVLTGSSSSTARKSDAGESSAASGTPGGSRAPRSP